MDLLLDSVVLRAVVLLACLAVCMAASQASAQDSTGVLGSLARTPAQLPSLLRTAIDARTAFRALLRGRRLLGPGLAYPDLGELLFDVS